MKNRKSRKTADREGLIAAALALGLQQGWKAVTIRKLANSVGYTSPVIYEHFEDKEDILIQVARVGFAKLVKALRLNQHSAEPEALAAAYWQFAFDHGALYRLMNNMDGALERPEKLRNEAIEVCQLVTASVDGWGRRNRTTFHSNEQLSDELWAFLHGMITLHMDRTVEFSGERVMSAVSAYLVGKSRIPERLSSLVQQVESAARLPRRSNGTDGKFVPLLEKNLKAIGREVGNG